MRVVVIRFKGVRFSPWSTKIFAIIFLNLEIYNIVLKKLSSVFFILCPPIQRTYIAQMQYIYDSLQTLFHTAILGGEGTVMK